MTDIITETTTSQETGNTKAAVVRPTKILASSSQTTEYFVYFFFGVIEILLAFRLILKVMGASLSSAFVGAIYGVTKFFIIPFEGIFRRGFTQGIETTSVLEPATLVAIVVYAILAWGIVRLVQISSKEVNKE